MPSLVRLWTVPRAFCEVGLCDRRFVTSARPKSHACNDLEACWQAVARAIISGSGFPSKGGSYFAHKTINSPLVAGLSRLLSTNSAKRLTGDKDPYPATGSGSVRPSARRKDRRWSEASERFSDLRSGDYHAER